MPVAFDEFDEQMEGGGGIRGKDCGLDQVQDLIQMAGQFVCPAVVIKFTRTAESRQMMFYQLSRLLAVVRSEKGFDPRIDAVNVLGELENERRELV